MDVREYMLPDGRTFILDEATAKSLDAKPTSKPEPVAAAKARTPRNKSAKASNK